MKTRIALNDETLKLSSQPEGYTEVSADFMQQYIEACKICSIILPLLNLIGKGLTTDEYNYMIKLTFLKCLNTVPKRVKKFVFTDWDFEDYTYSKI